MDGCQEQHSEQLKGVEAKVEESRVAHEAKAPGAGAPCGVAGEVQVENAVEAEALEASQRLAEAKVLGL